MSPTLVSEQRVWVRVVLAGVIVFILGLLIPRVTSPDRRGGVLPSFVERLRLDMSEKEVVSLLGKPDRVNKGHYDLNDPSVTKQFYYTLRDGRKWVIIISDHDRLIATGELEQGRGSSGAKKLSFF